MVKDALNAQNSLDMALTSPVFLSNQWEISNPALFTNGRISGFSMQIQVR